MTNAHSPRPIDHLVLPAASLDVARSRLGALGFTVAPTGVHPFGTENACVYFADGTFLEPLAVGDAALADAAVSAGNVFIARDRLFRLSHGDEGFSALVFGTADAASDHADFRARGVSAGDMLSFSRDFVGPDGKSDTASFRLAFATAGHTGDAFFFTCERINVPEVDRSALQAHANSATRLVAVTATGSRPGEWLELIAPVAGVEASVAENSIRAANATVEVLDGSVFADRFDLAAPDGPFRLAAVTFGVKNLAAAEAMLREAAILHHRIGDLLVVPPAPGQGAAFAFEENS
ncbi:VOC family protein [Allomesorhizobium camelthorni]|uniref:VOC family protein n=1 Tax=Allomesorhizobium camelthorni TaxID=475069 RepID=A0A6G4WDL8_9HYPH|nr:VOC family protein [Mesorhizobium camelthorni]NGO52684.1 VOC family protein [Mesorhizobium camelthorni]